MNVVIWIFQGILGLAFLMAGFMKISQSKEVLKEKIGGWVDRVALVYIRGIGALEIIGALGMIIPIFADNSPLILVLSTILLISLMIGAAGLHGVRKEYKEMIPSILFIGMLSFILYSKWTLITTIL